jgi:hypothetical protein
MTPIERQITRKIGMDKSQELQCLAVTLPGMGKVIAKIPFDRGTPFRLVGFMRDT